MIYAMSKRVCLIVLDACGIGELPDAAIYGDEGSNTLGNTYNSCESIHIPNLLSMGLGNIKDSKIPPCAEPTAAYGRLAEKTAAKDTTSGHWEMAGVIMEQAFKTYLNGFPDELMNELAARFGIGALGNIAASGTEIIKNLGDKHIATGKPIVYTSADSVLQIAACEDIIPIERLYELCEIAYEVCKPYHIGRIIARPFVKRGGEFIRTERRKDFSVPPVGETILDRISAAGREVYGVGKIEDIFSHRGLTGSNHTTNNRAGIEETISALGKVRDGLIFVNLVDTDMLFGHRNDVQGFADSLSYFDSRLPGIISALKPEDMLIVTADHGCDPTTPSTDHSREHIPLLVSGAPFKGGVDLGTGDTFSDIAATVCEYLGIEKWLCGSSFLAKILKD
jgi:phosphopentomutase